LKGIEINEFDVVYKMSNLMKDKIAYMVIKRGRVMYMNDISNFLRLSDEQLHG